MADWYTNRKKYSRGSVSEQTKRKISESLTGKKFEGEVPIDPKAGAELRSSVKVGDAFVHQGIVDWYRDLKGR